MDVLQNNSTIALFSPANFSFELFYLCKVCYFGYATDGLVDEYNHVVNVGAPYIKVKYYEKKAEKKGVVLYKLLKQFAYVLPSQVMVPVVSSASHVGNDMYLPIEEYQWLCDSI